MSPERNISNHNSENWAKKTLKEVKDRVKNIVAPKTWARETLEKTQNFRGQMGDFINSEALEELRRLEEKAKKILG